MDRPDKWFMRETCLAFALSSIAGTPCFALWGQKRRKNDKKRLQIRLNLSSLWVFKVSSWNLENWPAVSSSHWCSSDDDEEATWQKIWEMMLKKKHNNQNALLPFFFCIAMFSIFIFLYFSVYLVPVFLFSVFPVSLFCSKRWKLEIVNMMVMREEMRESGGKI